MTSVKEIFKNIDYGPAPESDSFAQEWLNKFDRQFKLYVNGRWQSAKSKKSFTSINPATKDKIASVSFANEKDVDVAVQSARAALSDWEKIGGHGRARYLYAIARHIQKNSRLFAVLESMDNGKPIRESRDIDIPLVARHFYHHAGWAEIRDTEFNGYQSLGVIGQIIPWNFPLLMLAWKIAPALAMGNTVVLKPAEFTSLTALLFADICDQVGLPAGVVNIVTGEGSTGAAIVNHKDVDKIAFTGSTEVGRIIRRATAGTGKKLSLELGGKSPFLVFEDADLDSVVEGVVDAIWFNQGQVCCAGSRLLVQESIAERLYAKIKERMEHLRVGNSLDKNTDIGAIVAPVQLKTIKSLVDKGIKEGNEPWQPSWACPRDGYFYPPTLFTDVSPSSTISQVEIFGPVLVATTFRTHNEAVKLANNTRYGLAASIWTENINLAMDIAPKIKAGTIWINSTNVFDAASGFGGYRESGFGREGGREGLFEYLKISSKKKSRDNKRKKVKSKSLSKESIPSIDKTAKMYIAGKQCRPDGGYSLSIHSPSDVLLGQVSRGNRKDIRNAVEAAHKASSWSLKTGHARAQVLYYMAENIAYRKNEFAKRLAQQLDISMKKANKRVELAIQRIYYYAAHADKYDGHVHHTVFRNVTLAMPEPVGVFGVICPDDYPLLGLISTVIPLITMGNSVIVVPSESSPLTATDFYQILETSDIPAGTINIVTGVKDELTEVLAKHDDVDGIWYFGSKEGSKMVEYESANNMKRTWVNHGVNRDWEKKKGAEGKEFLRRSCEIKNIWVPYGA